MSVGHWIGNAIKCAGRDIGHATDDVVNESGKIGNAIKKVPVVGGLLHGLYEAAFEGTLGLLIMTEQVTIQGERVDRVVLNHLKNELTIFKEVGPYAEMVCSFVPGVGQGISAAIGCGLALANGQPMSQALMAGVEGALPGGPLARMAFQAASQTVTSVIEHKPISWSSLAAEGVETVAAAVDLPLPDVAKKALEGGLTCVGDIVQGKRLDRSLVASFASALPIDPGAQKAIADVLNMGTSLAQGEKVTKVIFQQAVAALPVPPDVKQGLSAMKGTAFVVGFGGVENSPGKAMAIQIDHVITDIFLDHAKQHMNKAQSDSINIAIATVQGQHVQAVVAPQLATNGPVMNKLMSQGQDIIKTDSVVEAAYQTLQSGKIGFQVGIGLSRKQCNMHQALTLRKGLSKEDQEGFDMALSLHVGRVAHPKPKGILGPKAKAGYYATLGMQGAFPDQKTALMSTLASDPMTKLGAKTAVRKIVIQREGWWPKVQRYLGMRT